MDNLNDVNIFGENEHFIKDISYKKINQFLKTLKYMENIDNILEIIKHKIKISDVISNILNSEILKENKLILILIELYLNQINNNNQQIIIEIINLLISKILLKKDYVNFLCQHIIISNIKKEINENYIIKCIEIFNIFFNKNVKNNTNEILPEKNKVNNDKYINSKYDYFYFLNLNEGLVFENINYFSLNNSYLYISFKSESKKDFSIINIEIIKNFNIDISIINNKLIINVNNKIIQNNNEIIIENNKLYMLRINFKINKLKVNSISEKSFKVQLINEKHENNIKKTEKITLSKNEKTILYKITFLKNFCGIVKSIIYSNSIINLQESLFSFNNISHSYFILSPLSFNNGIIIEPINNYKLELNDKLFNSVFLKQKYLTLSDKIEILLPLFEFVSTNKYNMAAQNLLELVNNMLINTNKLKIKKYEKYIFIINQFIEFSQLNWIKDNVLQYDNFLNINLLRDFTINNSLNIFDEIIEKTEKYFDINEFKIWLYIGGKGNYKELRYFLFPKISSIFLNNNDDISDLFYLFSKKPNIFLFLFLIVIMQSNLCSKYYSIIRKNYFLILIIFYFNKGSFNELFINDTDNTIKNEIISTLRMITRKVYSKEKYINEEDFFLKNEIFFILLSLVDDDDINLYNNISFDIFKYIKEFNEKEKIKSINSNHDELLSIFNPKEISMKKVFKNKYKTRLKFWNYYKKIKKKLFLWNGPYSNKELFFDDESKKSKEIKYKLSNHLTKELALPLLVPIINIEKYLSDFTNFPKEKMFKNPFKDTYNINLYPFDNFLKNVIEKKLFFDFELDENLEFYVCYIKPIYHDRGFLEIDKINEKINFYSLSNYLSKISDKFDKEKKSCYGSLINSELKILRYKCIYLKDINFYIERTYLCLNSAIEIFTQNKSYLFVFEEENIKKTFIDCIRNLNNKIYPLDKKIVVEEWKKGYISNFEYLMKVNLFGNRSYKDLNQYPVFPWLVINNSIYENEEKTENIKSIYNSMNSINLSKTTINEKEDYLININGIIKSNLRPLNVPMGLLSLSEKGKNRKLNFINNYKIKIELLNNDKTYDIKFNMKNIINDIPQYDNEISSLYDNQNIPIEKIPYIFSNNFSNSIYVSHYLIRIFPFASIYSEIKKNCFDYPEKLFYNLDSTFISSSSKKNDIREIIPQFFYLPEMFVNINELNFGKIKNPNLDKNKKVFEHDNTNLYNEINDCLIPYYAKNNPYIFVVVYRKLLENKKINIEDWINLIFGEFSYGKKAQDKGNIFIPFCYKDFIEKRYNLNKKDSKIFYKLNELGNNPNKVFDKIITKNKICIHYPESINLGIEEISFKSIIDIYCKIDNDNMLSIKLIFQQKNNESYLLYKILINLEGEIINLETEEITNQNSLKNKIIKGFDSYQKFILTDSFNLFLLIPKTSFFKTTYQMSIYLNKKIITCLIISKDEKYLYLGTKFGEIIIFLFDVEIKGLYKQFIAHEKSVNYINENNILNMMSSCSDDGDINLYLLPNVELVRVIKLTNNFIPDYVFLSSNPLPSIIIYSNIKKKFLCYSINGKFFFEKNRKDEKDILDMNDNLNKSVKEKKNYLNDNDISQKNTNILFLSPYTIRLIDFNDYLVYSNGNIIIFRRFPFLEISFRIENYKNKISIYSDFVV